MQSTFYHFFDKKIFTIIFHSASLYSTVHFVNKTIFFLGSQKSMKHAYKNKELHKYIKNYNL